MAIKLKMLDSERNRKSGFVGKELLINHEDIRAIDTEGSGLVFSYSTDPDFTASYTQEEATVFSLVKRLKEIVG